MQYSGERTKNALILVLLYIHFSSYLIPVFLSFLMDDVIVGHKGSRAICFQQV